MLKILFLTNIPSPYRVDFFNELGKLCDLTVLFEKKTSSERDKSWANFKFDNFKGIFLKSKSVRTDAAVSFEAKAYLKDKSYDRIIVSNISTPTGMLAIQYMKNHHIKYYIEGDGGFAKSGKGIKERIKRHFIKGAKGYFSTSSEHDRYYLTYGAQKECIYRYPFTSIKESDIPEASIAAAEKAAIKRELNIKEEKVVVTVGQFVERKGFDVLIKAAKDLPSNSGVYFIGGEPTDEYSALTAALGLKNIRFIGFKLKDELKKYYMAADLFVLPTREDVWGLVINEALSQGLPTITTNRCIAGLELIEDGENGYIVPVDDEVALARKINEILSSDELKTKMQRSSLEKAREYTVEKMALRHLEILE